MHQIEDIIRQLAAMGAQIQSLSEQDHGDVAMVLFTVCASLGTDEGRRQMTSKMLELSGQLTV